MSRMPEHDAHLIAALRAEMKARNLSGYIVPHADAFQSEYLSPSEERLARLTGFTGSAGTALVLADEAAVFVDGRYTLQATRQLDADAWQTVAAAKTPMHAWLKPKLRTGDRIGYDAWLFTAGQIEALNAVCREASAELVAVEENLIDLHWPDRPATPATQVQAHKIEFAGLSSKAKRELVAEAVRDARADLQVLTRGDSVSWLFNIRADDIPYTPFALAVALVDADGDARLFIDEARFDEGVSLHLGGGVEVLTPEALGDALDEAGSKNLKVRLDRASAALWIENRLRGAGANVLSGDDPCQLPKAVKNKAEIQGMRDAHLRDARALCTFLAWLDDTAPLGGVTELSAAAEIDRLRSENERFRGLSFPTISGAGPNGAIVHYAVSEQSSRELKVGELYLVDSGGQYLDGTTDVTRTVAIGEPSSEMRDRFTRALKGHIAIVSQRFPKGTAGHELDVLARKPLWEAGLDYDHGTGHGVGSYLSVHEGPQRIARKAAHVPLEAGMVLSVEPGYYKADAYGIRIENLVLVRSVDAPDGAEHELFGFEVLTLAPIDQRLVEASLLTEQEAGWLDAYHARVLDSVSPLLEDRARVWLEEACRPLSTANKTP